MRPTRQPQDLTLRNLQKTRRDLAVLRVRQQADAAELRELRRVLRVLCKRLGVTPPRSTRR